MSKSAVVSIEQVAQSILLIRGHKVMLDFHLAALYGVETRVLTQAVKRNLGRFPDDFMFQPTNQEFINLRSQFVMSSSGHGGRRTAPYAFTEQGVAMLSTVLNSPRAITINIEIMRAFVRLRELLTSNKELSQRLDELESRIERKLETHDQAITGILHAIRELMKPTESKKRPIGFVTLEEKPNKPKAAKRKG